MIHLKKYICKREKGLFISHAFVNRLPASVIQNSVAQAVLQGDSPFIYFSSLISPNQNKREITTTCKTETVYSRQTGVPSMTQQQLYLFQVSGLNTGPLTLAVGALLRALASSLRALSYSLFSDSSFTAASQISSLLGLA